jgi:predicted RNase H-like nuclease (RuvC/YqgF family)
MNIYEEIADILGLNTNPETIDDVEKKLLEELKSLNENHRSLQGQINEVEESIHNLRNEISSHNKKAISKIESGYEDAARKELERKERKMHIIRKKESKLQDLRQHLNKIEEKRSLLENKLEKIRRNQY